MILTTKEVIARVRLSRCTLWRQIKEGRFPAAIALSPGKRGWLETAIAEWEAGCKAWSAPEPPQLRAARVAR
jgi:prophage regulatory protein